MSIPPKKFLAVKVSTGSGGDVSTLATVSTFNVNVDRFRRANPRQGRIFRRVGRQSSAGARRMTLRLRSKIPSGARAASASKPLPRGCARSSASIKMSRRKPKAAVVVRGRSRSVPVRRNFQDTAFWKADVVTDASGKATVSIPLPDNLTTWNFTAKGVTKDTLVGTGTLDILFDQARAHSSGRPALFRPG